MTNRRIGLRRVRSLGMLALILTTVGGLVLWFETAADHYGNDLAFDGAQWRTKTPWSPAGAGWTQTVRTGMADDLCAHALRPGMTRDEVLSLLGPPDRKSQDEEGFLWHYDLGLQFGWTTGRSELRLRFDPKGHLNEFFQVGD